MTKEQVRFLKNFFNRKFLNSSDRFTRYVDQWILLSSSRTPESRFKRKRLLMKEKRELFLQNIYVYILKKLRKSYA